jgi:hypothetical protein
MSSIEPAAPAPAAVVSPAMARNPGAPSANATNAQPSACLRFQFFE